MFAITGYSHCHLVAESKRCLIYRAEREADRCRVIVKVLKTEHAEAARTGFFRREYEVLSGLEDVEGVIGVHGLYPQDGTLVMVLEDFGGESLRRHMSESGISAEQIVRVAASVANTLGRLHKRNIVHKSVTPDHVLWNPATGKTKLIGFSLAASPRHSRENIYDGNPIEPNPAYVSPEQTGRINRSVDFRSDLYSLGVTLYELLTSEHPFRTLDPISMIHAHIAKTPRRASVANPVLDETLSDIVMKLMAKTPEDRYQSAVGLEKDLGRWIEFVQEGRTPEKFPLGLGDIREDFRIPGKIFGRSEETALLIDAHDRAWGGKKELVLITGPAGIGKSALVTEARKMIESRSVFFIEGKFEQYKNNIPYTPIIQAFHQLVRRMLTEDDTRLALWKKSLQEALGANGGVITALIPELTRIVGPQPKVMELPAQEATNRFHVIFQRLIGVFSRPEHLLAIFLDDLQWADSGSLKLIGSILTSPLSDRILVIGAYRDNHIDTGHALFKTLEEIRKEGAAITRIRLKPLNLGHISQLIAETLKHDPIDTMPLSRLCMKKTQGNPFFLIQWLTALHEQNLIRFDATVGLWRWDTSDISKSEVGRDAVNLMVEKIESLPDTSRRLLQIASCIGNTFDLGVLSAASGYPPLDTSNFLLGAMRENLIQPLAPDMRFISEPDSALTVSYKFLHDRIQQAAYSLMNMEQKQQTHLQLGRQLLNEYSPEDRGEKVFKIVEHLNQAVDLIQDDQEREATARLNLEAAKAARSRVAFESALNYFLIGICLLQENPWSLQPRLAVELHMGAAEAAYLSGDFGQMTRLSDAILQHSPSVLNRVKAHEIRLRTRAAQNDLAGAVEEGVRALAALGVPMPESVSKLTVLGKLLRTRLLLFPKRKKDWLSAVPETTDPLVISKFRVLSAFSSVTYWSAPKLLTLSLLEGVGLILRHGNCCYSPYILAGYGFILCASGKIRQGYRFGQISAELLKRFKKSEPKTRTGLVLNALVFHWREPLADSLRPLSEGFTRGLETGDLEFAAYNAMIYCYHSLLSGTNLANLEKEIAGIIKTIVAIRQKTQLTMIRLHMQAVLNLAGETNQPWDLSGRCYVQSRMIEKHRASGDRTTLAAGYFYNVFLGYLFGKHDFALEKGRLLENDLISITGTYLVPFYYFLKALNLLALYPEKSVAEKFRSFRGVKRILARMKGWALHCPSNHLAKYHLIHAELARVRKKERRARNFYRKAILEADRHRLFIEKGIAFERYAEFWLGIDEKDSAWVYLKKAHQVYKAWGALAKTRQLENRYPAIFPHSLEVETEGATKIGSALIGKSSESMDLEVVTRAAQAISGEIIPKRLLMTLMTLLMENAGATRALLFLEKDGRLFLEAEGDTAKDSVECLQTLPVEKMHGNLPLAIINYVERTSETLVLDNAYQEGVFIRDPYILSKRVKSALCIPLIRQQHQIGMLYLENNLTPGVFTSERTGVLKVLSAQAAISIENSRLFESLAKRAAESEERFRIMFEQSMIGIARIDLDGRILDVNKALGEILGRTVDELCEMSIGGLPGPQKQGTDLSGLIRAITERSFYTLEKPFFRKDQSVVWGKITASMAKDHFNKPLFALILFEDITARKNTEAALVESEEKYRNVAERANDGIAFIVDEKIHYANPRLADMTGYAIDDLIGMPFIDLIYPDEKPKVHDMLIRRVSGEDVTPMYESSLRHKSGGKIFVEFNAGLAPFQGKVADLVMIRNITDRKKIEHELLKSKKLESIGILAGGIAHDYNNILAAILGNISLAKMVFPREKVLKILDSAEGATFKAKALTHKLLTFSKGGEPQKKTANIRSLLKASCQLALSGSNIEYDIRFPETLANVYIDEEQIGNVFNNLLFNAREAMPGGGKVSIRVETVSLAADNTLMLDAADYVKISFTDQGPGIARENFDKIFDPYYSTKERGVEKGMGMGLSVSLSIVRKHAGAIALESEPGVGSTFIVYLPVSDKPIQISGFMDNKPIREKCGGGMVLVMDDEEYVRKLVEQILEFEGCEVALSTNGAEAIALYQKALEEGKRFDVVLLDMTIRGGMGGIATLERLKKIDPTVKAIVSTGYSDDPVLTHFESHGFYAAIAKPYTSSELAATVKKVQNLSQPAEK